MSGRGRPILGAICGLLLGLFLGIDLFLFGIVPLDSVVITLLVVLGLVAGIVLGLRAPLNRSRSSSS